MYKLCPIKLANLDLKMYSNFNIGKKIHKLLKPGEKRLDMGMFRFSARLLFTLGWVRLGLVINCPIKLPNVSNICKKMYSLTPKTWEKSPNNIEIGPNFTYPVSRGLVTGLAAPKAPLSLCLHRFLHLFLFLHHFRTFWEWSLIKTLKLVIWGQTT